VPGALSPGGGTSGREIDHSLQARAEVKNAWSYTFILHYISLRGA